jgi:hypothetical protein
MQGAGIGLQGVGQQLAAGQLGLAGGAQNIQGLQAAMQGSGLGLQGANQAINAGQLGLQGTQAGLQGFGLGLQGNAQGLQGANQAINAGQLGVQGGQLGIQGSQAGLAGVGQAINAGQLGLQGAGVGLQGTAQGMQGAQVGLQGVGAQQAGYGLANQSATALGNLGNQQLAAQTGILGLQNQIGSQQQAQEQAIVNQAIQNYANAQQQPLTNLNQYNALLRGYALPGTTTTQYQAQASPLSQAAGAATALYGASQLGKKKGGRIREPKRSGVHTLALRKAMKG